MRPRLIFSKPYYNQTEGEDPRSGKTYELCNLAKTDCTKVDDRDLEEYARQLNSNMVLIPVPGHDGDTDATFHLCWQLLKCYRRMYGPEVAEPEIANILEGDAHPSLCEVKRNGLPTDDIRVVHHVKNARCHEAVHDFVEAGKRLILVDNVLDTGKTVLAAAKAIGHDCDVLTLGYTGRERGIYNPLGMYDALLGALDKEYQLCWVDYRNEFLPKDIEECIKQKGMWPLTENDYWDEARRDAARSEAASVVLHSDYEDEDKDRFITSDLFSDLIIEIEGRDVSNPERDALFQTRVHARVTLDSDYDCWVPPYDAGGLYSKDTALWGLMAELCLNPKKVKKEASKVFECFGPWPDIKSREGREVVSYAQFVKVLRECPNYGKWAFFGLLDTSALYESHFDTDAMTIPKGTTCGMYNSWNGGGSLAFAETLRPVNIKELKRRAAPYMDGVSVLVDEKGCGRGYASSEVYGGPVSDDTVLE